MFFDQKFIEWVEENPIEGLAEAVKKTMGTLNQLGKLDDSNEWTDRQHELLWDASTFMQLVMEANNIDFDVSFPNATSSLRNNCDSLYLYIKNIAQFVDEQAIQLKINSYKNQYNSALKNTFAYEFSQGDLARVQELVNEIRSKILESQSFEEEHKSRILKRLEKLQTELHKRVSDLDRFWGLVGDAGVVLGKLGTDAKPIVDRVKEIAEIVWKTQARAEELPSDSNNPMLEHDGNA